MMVRDVWVSELFESSVLVQNLPGVSTVFSRELRRIDCGQCYARLLLSKCHGHKRDLQTQSVQSSEFVFH